MKKAAAMVVTLVLFVAFIPCAFAADAEEVPEEVRAYAEETAQSVRSLIKNPNDYYMKNVFTSESEVDALTLGGGYRVYYFNTEAEGPISGTLTAADQWIFSLDSKKGPVALFEVYRADSGKLSYSGTEVADNLDTAMQLMRRLAKKAGVKQEPKVLAGMLNYALYLDFNGDERVITVPTSGMGALDESYLKVTDYRQLPTAADYIGAIAGQEGAEGSYGGGTVTLLPDLSAEIPAGTGGAGKYLPYVIGAAALAAVCVAAALIAKKRGAKA